jgi:hypothetical protein
VDWLPSAACGLISAATLWRWRSLGGRRPPRRFWLGLALQAPIWGSAYYAFAESWILAAWGLWLALDGLSASCGRPALLGRQPEAAVWALVISTFGWAGIDYLNEYFPTWTMLGFSFNPLVREVTVGLLGAPVVPMVLAVASLFSPDSTCPAPQEAATPWRLIGVLMIAMAWFLSLLSDGGVGLSYVVIVVAILVSPRFFAQERDRLLPLAVGAAAWTAFDALWSQMGPAERLDTGVFAGATQLPVSLYVSAFCLTAVYNAAVDFLDKPRFDPFSRDE